MLTIMESQERPTNVQVMVLAPMLANYDGSRETFDSYMERYYILERK